MPSLSQDEIAKYWEIFSAQEPMNGLVNGDKMRQILRNSQLDDSKLARIWDLADIDGDGSMDFEEFCIAMRLVFDQLKSPEATVPAELPGWLIPADKQHLVTAKQALSGGSSVPTPSSIGNDDDEDLTLSPDFNWYISPQDRRTYESVYSVNADNRGRVAFGDFTELYQTLDNVPDTDVSLAWNSVNPRSDEKIDKEQAIVFLHMLNQRSKGVRMPRSVPPSLRATFGKEVPSYDVGSSQSEIRRPSTGSGSSASSRKDSFAEGYLSRLGLGGRSQGYNSSGTDFSATKDTDWEEVRLKRELADLNERLERIEEAKKRQRQAGTSNSGVVRRELQLLLEYKQKQAQDGTKNGPGGDTDLGSAREEVQMISEQVDALRDHLKTRNSVLDNLKSELATL